MPIAILIKRNQRNKEIQNRKTDISLKKSMSYIIKNILNLIWSNYSINSTTKYKETISPKSPCSWRQNPQFEPAIYYFKREEF